MNTSKHTPGPWACNVWMVGNNVPTGEITISGPEGDEHICTMDGNEDNLANGNLIAAAPAMYEALLQTRKVIEAIDDYQVFEDLQNVLIAINKTLTQAEGKE